MVLNTGYTTGFYKTVSSKSITKSPLYNGMTPYFYFMGETPCAFLRVCGPRFLQLSVDGIKHDIVKRVKLPKLGVPIINSSVTHNFVSTTTME